MAEAQISQIAASQISNSNSAMSTTAMQGIPSDSASAVNDEYVNQFQTALDSPINNSRIGNASGDVRYGFMPNYAQNPYSIGSHSQDNNLAMDVMQNVRDKFEGIKNEIEAISNKKDFTQVDLMHLQMSIIQLSYIADLSAKTADKMSQAAQTLFRNQ